MGKGKSGWAIFFVILVLFIAALYVDFASIDSSIFRVWHKAPVAITPPGGIIPSSGYCELTLNTKDSLASTDLNANVTYAIFNADSGALITTGTTAAGKVSLDLNFGNNYKIATYDDDGTSPDYYWQTEFIQEGSTTPTTVLNCNEPGITVYMYLIKESAINTTKLRDPSDFDSNISLAASGTAGFDVLLKVETSRAGTRKPALAFNVNNTAIKDIDCGTADITLPSRFTAESGRKYFAVTIGRDMVLSKDGIIEISCSIEATTLTPTTTDYINTTTLDKTYFKLAQARNIADFVEAYENTESLSDIGSIDQPCEALTNKARCQLVYNG